MRNENSANQSHVDFLVHSEDSGLHQRYVMYALPARLPLGIPSEVYTAGLVGLDLFFILVYIILSGLIIWRAPGGWFPILAAFALIPIPIRVPPELRLLASTVLFAPLRSRVQNFIDRRFYRQKYNAAQALETFAIAARSQVELDQTTPCGPPHSPSG